MREPPDSFQQAQHGARLARRPARDVKKRQQLIRRPAFETLRDVVACRNRRPLDLILQTALPGERPVLRERIDPFRQPDGLLPHRQTFKTLVGHKLISHRKSEISNVPRLGQFNQLSLVVHSPMQT